LELDVEDMQTRSRKYEAVRAGQAARLRDTAQFLAYAKRNRTEIEKKQLTNY
jgi:hypothetical protein